MNIKCPNRCELKQELSPKTRLIVRYGSFRRKSDSRWVARFFCKNCRSYFSRATFQACVGQKKRHLNSAIWKSLCSGVSQRRTALILNINQKTVARKLTFLAERARFEQEKRRKEWIKKPLFNVQFDDMESSIHSKCKPCSIALAVEPKTRKILDFQVSVMPPKGKLAAIGRAKYGPRPDRRGEGWEQMFQALCPMVSSKADFLSDQNPHYPRFVKKHFPNATHRTTKGRRGCVVGQGELKRGGFDPLFSLNHTAAMLRANINRLFRRTWCTSKKIECLRDHIQIYVKFHNEVLTAESTA